MALGGDTLEALRDELLKARAKGVRTLQINGERVEYKTDAEMAAAIADLEARIKRVSSHTPGIVRFRASKGF